MRASDVHENLAHLSRELVELLGEYKALQLRPDWVDIIRTRKVGWRTAVDNLRAVEAELAMPSLFDEVES